MTNESDIKNNPTPQSKETPLSQEEKPEAHSAINQLNANQNNLMSIHHDLASVVDALNCDRSLITRVAQYWGGMSTLKKVMFGVALTAPTVAIGFFAHVVLCYAVSGVTFVLYTTSGAVLNEHHRANLNTDKIKSNVLHISNILTCIIDAMGPISKSLSKSAMDYKLENSRFAKSNESLLDQINLLNTRIKKVLECNHELVKLKDDLATKQERTQQQLNEKISEFGLVRDQMAEELKNARLIAEALQGTMVTASNALLGDVQEKKKFQKKLSAFVNDKERSFLEISDVIFKAQADLKLTTEKLNQVTNEYRTLLDHNERQVTQLSGEIHKLREINATKSRLNSMSIFNPKHDYKSSLHTQDATFVTDATDLSRRNSCVF